MWTPKRILLVVLGLGLFVGCYGLYAHQLGMIDGLPPLPDEYWPNPGNANKVIDEVRPPGAILGKLDLAFGRECPESKLPIKIEVPSRGIVLATKDVRPLPDGRVHLEPLSIAIYGKNKGEDGTPEINTIRAAIAFLTFEQPIQNVADMGKYRITAAQIEHDILIVNNRHSLTRDDDVSVDVKKGPLYYDAKTRKVWSDDFVRIKDMQSKPRATEVTGQAFVLELLAEQPQGKNKAVRQPARQMEAITGVKTALLKSAVEMHLCVDSRSGFLSGSPAKTSAKAPPDAKTGPEKLPLIIKTQGPFFYDLVKDFATFDIPAVNPARPQLYPEHVVVTRGDANLGKLDHLVCEHLELQFRKKGDPKTAARPPAKPKKAQDTPGDQNSSKDIEWAHAVGKSVLLASDEQMLDAHGHDFFYDARTQTSTLKGKPMRAIKEVNEIQAAQLQLTNSKDGQSARAQGPGTLSLFDKSSSGKKPMRARWNDWLISSKEGELDVLRLIGKASFTDEETGQELQADDLKVWLLPQAKKPTGAKPEKEQGTGSRKPHHLIATGNVRSKSKDFNIRDAQRFVVWFSDAPPGTPAPAKEKKSVPGEVKTPPQPGKPEVATKPTEPTKPEEKQPIDLWGRAVEARVMRIGDKSQLQSMTSEGGVHVVQAPSKPGEKGVDIKGETLDLTAHEKGNVLIVRGDLARLDMDRMLILGPEVNIDQVANKAWVNGIGAMTIESDTDFQGNKLKKAAPLTIHWNKGMVFSGNQAVFHGGIQADQNNARLTCQELQVFFDKEISLKENQKDKEKAKVRNLTCDREALIEDSVIENGKEIKYQQLKSPAIAIDNQDGKLTAVGPGEVRLMQAGDANPGQQPPARNAQKNQEMKLTFISFYERMQGKKEPNIAYFRNNVRVLHLPGDNPRIDLDMDKTISKLPPGAMYIRSDLLKVLTRPNPAGGKGWQHMEAEGRVWVASPEFSGQAHRVTYDEEKDQVIFNGGNGGVATLYKVRVPGERAQKIVGNEIIYSRRDNKHTGTGLREIEGR